MDEPQPADLYRRLKESFGPTYLTALSIIQAVALADLATIVAAERSHFTIVHWLLVLISFCVLIVTWHVYTLQSVMWDWIPDLRDAAIPFLFGAVELFINHTISLSLPAWFLALAAFAFLGAFAARHINWRAKGEPENAALLEVLGSHHRLFADYLTVTGVVLLVVAALCSVTGADAVAWGQGGRGVLAACVVIFTGLWFLGAVYIDQEYLRKAVVYARGGRVPRLARVRRRGSSATESSDVHG